ncbi:MAG: hypothetical protein A3E87_10620 [Gammaproteobacteria bacterium RIFCSPHIGHO2_12_FULL_35_23]|nr:MAG: hypothetical protein A3E87_10620 [Gammaproteobacteria bacterium RIFCSPHIGHO2_12_FULL_35_23]
MDDKALDLLNRLDRIPVWPYSYWILITVGAGFFFAFFDIITIGLALPVLSKQFQISTETALWAISSGLIGYIIGAFLDSRISDLLGRRLALILSMLFFSVGSILSATSPNIEWLIVWRFIIGMGIGSEIANVTTYIAELSPASCRGRFTALAITIGFLGFSVVPFVGLALIPHFNWGWRILFACGGLGGFAILFSRRFIPNTIRWYISTHQYQQAETELLKAEQIACKRFKRSLPTPSSIASPSPVKMNLRKLFHPPYLLRLIFFMTLWLIYYLGNYGWLTLNTNLFLMKGFNLTHSLLLVAINSLGFIVGAVLAIFLSDIFERKYLISLIALLWTISLLLIAWFMSMTIILIFGFVSTATIAFFIPLLYTYTAENFPTPCRATSVAITDGIGHFSAAFCGQIILGVYSLFKASGYGVAMAFTTMALTGLLTALLVLLGKRMTGKQLSQ